MRRTQTYSGPKTLFCLKEGTVTTIRGLFDALPRGRLLGADMILWEIVDQSLIPPWKFEPQGFTLLTQLPYAYAFEAITGSYCS